MLAAEAAATALQPKGSECREGTVRKGEAESKNREGLTWEPAGQPTCN